MELERLDDLDLDLTFCADTDASDIFFLDGIDSTFLASPRQPQAGSSTAMRLASDGDRAGIGAGEEEANGGAVEDGAMPEPSPLSYRPSRSNNGGAASEPARSTLPLRILFVDPQHGAVSPQGTATLLEMVTQNFLPRPCVFDVATELLQALSDADATPYDIIFLADQLGYVSGQQLSRFLRQRQLRSHIVLILPRLQTYDAAELAAFGVSAVLARGFKPELMREVIARLCFPGFVVPAQLHKLPPPLLLPPPPPDSSSDRAQGPSRPAAAAASDVCPGAKRSSEVDHAAAAASALLNRGASSSGGGGGGSASSPLRKKRSGPSNGIVPAAAAAAGGALAPLHGNGFFPQLPNGMLQFALTPELISAIFVDPAALLAIDPGTLDYMKKNGLRTLAPKAVRPVPAAAAAAAAPYMRSAGLSGSSSGGSSSGSGGSSSRTRSAAPLPLQMTKRTFPFETILENPFEIARAPPARSSRPPPTAAASAAASAAATTAGSSGSRGAALPPNAVRTRAPAPAGGAAKAATAKAAVAPAAAAAAAAIAAPPAAAAAATAATTVTSARSAGGQGLGASKPQASPSEARFDIWRQMKRARVDHAESGEILA